MKKTLLFLISTFSVGLLILACKQAPTEKVEEQMEKAAVEMEAPAHEKFLYVACVNVGKEDPDFVAVVGVDPADPKTYGKLIHRVDMPNVGDELHHFGYNHDMTYLMVPGLFSGRIHIVDVSNPARPTLKVVNEELTAKSGYTAPHTVIALPDGNNLVTMIGANTDSTAPGGVVVINGKTGQYVRTFGPPVGRDYEKVPPEFMYDAGIKLELNRMVTTSFGLPGDVAPGITVDGLGTNVYVWDWKAEKVIQTANIGPGTGALEVRWRRDKDSTIGYTNAPGTSAIWAWHDLDGDGEFAFKEVLKLPEGSLPTDMLLSNDDRYMYLGNWGSGSVQQYNIEDPLKPRLTGEVKIPYAQMLRMSPDNKRLYVTNSLLSTWDDGKFPEGVTRNKEYGIFLLDVDHGNGGISRNPSFHVNMMDVQKKNTKGAARPHMMLFDPSVKSEFGHH